MFEKEAEEYANRFWGNKESLDRACTIDNFKDGAEFGYNKGKAETALLSQHILDLQKDKGNLTDRVRELEQQIEKMKCCINDLVHLGEFNEHTDEEYFNYQVHEALNNAEQFIKEVKEK